MKKILLLITVSLPLAAWDWQNNYFTQNPQKMFFLAGAGFFAYKGVQSIKKSLEEGNHQALQAVQAALDEPKKITLSKPISLSWKSDYGITSDFQSTIKAINYCDEQIDDNLKIITTMNNDLAQFKANSQTDMGYGAWWAIAIQSKESKINDLNSQNEWFIKQKLNLQQPTFWQIIEKSNKHKLATGIALLGLSYSTINFINSK